MPESTRAAGAQPVPPPTRHQMAAMIWIAVFPTLTVLNLSLGGVLAGAPVVLRTLVLATIAVPIVIYALMPPLQRLRAALIRRGGEA
jgi:antibiotic biosynthesis monooxygenase (ABM) superfamily enzyme